MLKHPIALLGSLCLVGLVIVASPAVAGAAPLSCTSASTRVTAVSAVPKNGEVEVRFTLASGASVTAYSTDNGTNSTEVAISASPYTITGLTNGTSYQIKLRDDVGNCTTAVTAVPSAWPLVTAPANSAYSTIYGGGMFAGVRSQSNVTNRSFYSEDGSTWSLTDTGGELGEFPSGVYGTSDLDENMFVAVSKTGRVAWSKENWGSTRFGKEWRRWGAATQGSFGMDFRGVGNGTANGRKVFVAVGTGYTTSGSSASLVYTTRNPDCGGGFKTAPNGTAVWQTDNTKTVSTASVASNVATITTSAAHNLWPGLTVTVAGVGALNGSRIITAAGSDTVSFAAPNFTVTAASISADVATLTTSTANNLQVGDTITVANVAATLNGARVVTAVNTTNRTVSFAAPAGATFSVTAASVGSRVATLTTSSTPNLAAGDTITVSGVNAALNGTRTITGVNATTKTVSFAAPTYSVTAASVSSGVATLTTSATHNLKAGDTITVAGVSTALNGARVLTSASGTSLTFATSAANGSITLSGTPTAQLTTAAYTLSGTPTLQLATAKLAGTPTLQLTTSTVTTSSPTLQATNCWVSSDPAYLGNWRNVAYAKVGGTTDTWIAAALSGSSPGKTTGGLAISTDPTCSNSPVTVTNSNIATAGTATFTTGTAHGLAVGDSVRVDGMSRTALNTVFVVSGVGSATTFTGAYTGSATTGSVNGSGTAKKSCWKALDVTGLTGVMKVKFLGGKFVAVTSEGKVATSTDGTSWTIQNSGTSVTGGPALNDVDYNGTDTYVAVGNSGKVVRSTDNGSTWAVDSTIGSNVNWNGVVYGEGKFVALGGNPGTAATSTSFIMASS